MHKFQYIYIYIIYMCVCTIILYHSCSTTVVEVFRIISDGQASVAAVGLNPASPTSKRKLWRRLCPLPCPGRKAPFPARHHGNGLKDVQKGMRKLLRSIGKCSCKCGFPNFRVDDTDTSRLLSGGLFRPSQLGRWKQGTDSLPEQTVPILIIHLQWQHGRLKKSRSRSWCRLAKTSVAIFVTERSFSWNCSKMGSTFSSVRLEPPPGKQEQWMERD